MAAKHPQFTLADRVVAWFAPGAAVRRAQARSVLSYYEAARPDRLRKGRRATGSANDDVQRAGSTLREIARHLEQNYDLALGVLNTLVVNVVGPKGVGIEPQPRNADGSINDDLARQILELLRDWQTTPEVTRQHDWPSAQRLLCRSWLRDGEVFAQLVAGTMASLDHGSRVPFSIEMLEADYVPMGLQATAPAAIQQGIETNAWGAPVAYHVLRDEPSTSAALGGRTKRIGADRMLHLKNVQRIRQLRGVSIFASVLNRFDDLKDYEESERIAAKIAASMAAYIKKGAPDTYNPQEQGDDTPRQMKFRPGMVFDDLRPGEDIGMIDTNRPNPNLETYRSGQMKAIAAGTGPTFSSIARTYDGTYSAQRQELVEGYAAYATLSEEFIGRIVRPVYERFIATAVASGVLRVPAGIKPGTLDDATYMPPAMPWIDPRKEAEAWALLEDRAYASGPEIVRKRGGNPIDTLEQQARWRREKEKQGIPHNAALQAANEAPDVQARARLADAQVRLAMARERSIGAQDGRAEKLEAVRADIERRRIALMDLEAEERRAKTSAAAATALAEEARAYHLRAQADAEASRLAAEVTSAQAQAQAHDAELQQRLALLQEQATQARAEADARAAALAAAEARAQALHAIAEDEAHRRAQVAAIDLQAAEVALAELKGQA